MRKSYLQLFAGVLREKEDALIASIGMPVAIFPVKDSNANFAKSSIQKNGWTLWESVAMLFV
jgi:hypothetical protein